MGIDCNTNDWSVGSNLACKLCLVHMHNFGLYRISMLYYFSVFYILHKISYSKKSKIVSFYISSYNIMKAISKFHSKYISSCIDRNDIIISYYMRIALRYIVLICLPFVWNENIIPGLFQKLVYIFSFLKISRSYFC